MSPGSAAALPIVGIAASAGGVDALQVVVAALPEDLPAAVLVALHLPYGGRSMLAHILARAGPLPVSVAEPGLALLPGRVVVAVPDRHLLVRHDRVVLGSGPRENGHRPAHDAMLRSIALAAGSSAVGVVLTGLLDDGAAGLRAVRRRGGTCLVQHPDEAEFPSMPQAALHAVPDALSVPLSGLGTAIAAAVAEAGGGGDDGSTDPAAGERALVDAEVRSAEQGLPGRGAFGLPSPFACPDCSGVLHAVPDDGVPRFRCRTGHAWGAESLVARQAEQTEAALWVALRVLEERVELSRTLAGQARENRRAWAAEHFLTRAEEAERSVLLIRRVLNDASAADAPEPEPGGP